MIKVVSIATPFSFNKMLVTLPGLSNYERHRAPERQHFRTARLRTGQQKSAPRRRRNKDNALLDPRAASLDQNEQDNNNQYSGDYPDNHGSIHIDSSFLND
jgi:hypothetical protein